MLKYRSDLAVLFQSKNVLGKGVEIAKSNFGEFSQVILSKYLGHLYLVDPWATQDFQILDDIKNLENHEANYLLCQQNLIDYIGRYTQVRLHSTEAASQIEDESLDFVYIDGNHKYQYVKQDLEAWLPKVRQGGIIGGHDYLNTEWNSIPETAPNGIDKYIYSSDGTKLGSFGVNPAVDEFCSQNNYLLQKTTIEFLGSWYIIK